MIVVTEGLKAGEKVIVEGFQRVRQGIPVSAKPYTDSSKTEGTQDASEKKSSVSASRKLQRRSSMSRFFINRPIVAMVISIVMVIVGIVSFLSLPVAQYPNLVAA